MAIEKITEIYYIMTMKQFDNIVLDYEMEIKFKNCTSVLKIGDTLAITMPDGRENCIVSDITRTDDNELPTVVVVLKFNNGNEVPVHLSHLQRCINHQDITKENYETV